MNTVRTHLRSNIVGYAALFVALGGTGYAAVSIPRGSVGAAQLRNHSVTPVKLNPADITGSVRAWAVVKADGTVIASGGHPTVTAISGVPGEYSIQWGVVLPRTCTTVANVDIHSPAPTETVPLPGGTTQSVAAGYISEVNSQPFPKQSQKTEYATTFTTLNQSGQPTPLAFDVAVIC
jgi:hypothetical protein